MLPRLSRRRRWRSSARWVRGVEPERKKSLSTDLRTGKMSVQLPPYMSLDHDKETRKASLSILDREQRKQREMWGMSAFTISLCRSLIFHRYNTRIPEQSHPWGVRRPYCYSAACWGWLQSDSRAISSLRAARISRTAIRFIEGRLFASYRTRCPTRHESKHTATYAHIVGRGGEGGGESVRGEDQEVEGTRTV